MTERVLHVHMHATIVVPAEAVENEEGRGWVLPDGTIIKPFVVLEKNEMDNLTYDEGVELGFYLEDDSITSISEQ